jgi:hypothetical protein
VGIFPALFPLCATIFLFLKKNKKDFRYNRGYNSKLEAFSKLLGFLLKHQITASNLQGFNTL